MQNVVLALLLNHLNIFGFNEEDKLNLQHEIQISLRHLEGRQKAIIEVLEGSGKGPER